MEYLIPKHCRLVKLGIPTENESKNWFQRYEKQMPEIGELVFFDRSWYSRAMIQPTMRYCNKSQYKYFMENVNNWEKTLIDDGLILIKFYLSVNKPTQKMRFHIRENHQLK